ncbi:MAG: hypothetical protein HGA98_02675, partial [Deltaproteobacteria bacterium]|nr:hypothetical protein [Deltaproteobacteria bacterium]
MPQSLAIGAFVFGAVLLLLALAGGGFKLFGAEVSGVAGRTARVVSFLLGLALIGVGLSREVGPPAPAPTPAPAPAPPGAPSPTDS